MRVNEHHNWTWRCFSALLGAAAFTLSIQARAGLFEDSVSGKTTATTSEEVITPDTPAAGEAEAGEGEAGAAAAAPVQTVIERVVEASGLAFDLNGHIRGGVFAGKMPDYSRAVLKSGYGELALKLLASKGTYGNAFADLRFRAGYLGDETYLGQPYTTPPTGTALGEFDTRIDLREAYVNAYAGKLELRLGKQIVVWGRADGINPTNNLTPMDLRVRSPEEDDRRVGNLALRAHLNLNPVRIEGVWVPIYVPSYFPSIDVPEPVRFLEPDYPSLDLAKGTLAARVHLIFPAIEGSISYLHGFATQPGIAQDSYSFSEEGNFIYVRRAAFEQHVVGVDFSTTIAGEFGLRGEAAYRYPVDYQNLVHVPSPDINFVIGADREFGPVSIIAQYNGRVVFDWKDPANPLSWADIDLDNLGEQDPEYLNSQLPRESLLGTMHHELTRINQLLHGQKEQVQHGVSARVAWSGLHETLSLSLFGMINITTLEWVLYPKMIYNITDAMTLSIGGEIYMGPEDTLFNYIEEVLSAGYAELRISF